MHLSSLVFALIPFASAHLRHHHHHHHVRALSTTSLSLPLSPSLPLPPLSLPSLPPSFSLQSSPPLPSSPPPTSTSPYTTSAPVSASTQSSSSSAPASTPSSTPSTTTTAATPATTAQQTDPAFTPTTAPDAAASLPPDPSSSVVVFPLSSTITPSPTATSTASTGFFSNTGAVAGTFTVVGLVGFAGVIAVALLIVRRRHSRSYDEDMEYLDKSPNRSSDPPLNQPTSPDDGFTSDHGHYTASPMVLATPPAAYYPDHAHALQPQLFSADPPGSRGHPAGQDYAPQHVYSTDDYGIAYPPSAPHVEPGMPNPHEFAQVQLDSAPVPLSRAAPPDALRPSVKPTSTVPKQWENTRFSVDSFYAGIALDNHSPPGRAL